MKQPPPPLFVPPPEGATVVVVDVVVAVVVDVVVPPAAWRKLATVNAVLFNEERLSAAVGPVPETPISSFVAFQINPGLDQ